jgi:drug/metabolite transporter (DMT)-like permease
MKKAFIQLHVAVFLAGFTAILGKLITLHEGMLVWYRMLITAVTLMALLYFKKELQRLSLKNIFKIFSVGAIVALHWLTFYGSIKYSNVSVSLTCLSAIGFFTAFLDPIIMRRRIDITEVFLGMLAIAGIYLIFDFYPQYKLGILFGIISAMLASLFPILNKNLLKEFSPKTVTLYEMCGGVIALTFIMPLYLKMFPAEYYFPTISDWLWLLVLSWLCTVFAFILSLNALKKVSPFTANLAYNLEPVYGIILAFIIFKENKYLSAGFYYGLGLILLAVILQMLRVVWKARGDRRITE